MLERPKLPLPNDRRLAVLVRNGLVVALEELPNRDPLERLTVDERPKEEGARLTAPDRPRLVPRFTVPVRVVSVLVGAALDAAVLVEPALATEVDRGGDVRTTGERAVPDRETARVAVEGTRETPVVRVGARVTPELRDGARATVVDLAGARFTGTVARPRGATGRVVVAR
jgi:hypothetical protein